MNKLSLNELNDLLASKQRELDLVQGDLAKEKEKNRTTLQFIESFYKSKPEAEFLYYIFKDLLINLNQEDRVRTLSLEQLLDAFECVYEEARHSCKLFADPFPPMHIPAPGGDSEISGSSLYPKPLDTASLLAPASPLQPPPSPHHHHGLSPSIHTSNAPTTTTPAAAAAAAAIAADTAATLFNKSPRSQQSISNAFNYLIKTKLSIIALRTKKHTINYAKDPVRQHSFIPLQEIAYGTASQNYLVAYHCSPAKRNPLDHQQGAEPLFLKQITKGYVMQSQDYAFADEFDFFSACNHLDKWPRHIVRLKYAFTDRNNLNFLLKFYPGGDLLHYYLSDAYMDSLDALMAFSEPHDTDLTVSVNGDIPVPKSVLAAYYSPKILPAEIIPRYLLAKMVLCVEAVHALGFIHRSIKMEDFMFTKRKRLRICDFGSSVRLSATGKCPLDKMSITNCHEYSAPELVASLHTGGTIRGTSSNSKIPHDRMSTEYGVEVDLWSLGCILYELLCGDSPFRADNKRLQFTRIKRIEWEFVDEIDLSDAARDLISTLLCAQSSRIPTIDRLKQHVFFEGIDWTAMAAADAFGPDINAENPFDTSNFDDTSSNLTALLQFNQPYDNLDASIPDLDTEEFGSTLPFVGIAFNAYNLDQQNP